MMHPSARVRRIIAGAALSSIVGAAFAEAASAQTQYYNLEGGRPVRIEDAVATERYALDVQLAPIRVERLRDGLYRWRVEPKVSFGALPMTEFALRVPYSGIRSKDPGGVRETGVTSMTFGALRALNLERTRIPAFAVAFDVQLPAGSLAAPKTTYGVKVLATKTTTLGRVHVNMAGGSYSVRVPVNDACAGSSVPLPGCDGYIPDPPCLVTPSSALGDDHVFRAAAMCSPEPAAEQLVVAASTPRTSGARWVAGVGVDHAFPLASWLLTADLVAERFQGFQSKTDMTAELGVRWQWTPRLVIDGGIGRRYAGQNPSSSITLGVTFSAIARPRPRMPATERSGGGE